MSITSEEIANKEFLVGLRGYDKDEVRTFLQTVAAAFASQPGPSDAAPEAAGAAPATGMSNLGGQIEAILATANGEVEKLRADTATAAAQVRAEADAYAQSTRAEAEQHANEARQQLTSAQDEALGLVADAQVRVEKMIESSRIEAQEKAQASVAHLTAQVSELTNVRNSSKEQLGELRSKIDKALSFTEA